MNADGEVVEILVLAFYATRTGCDILALSEERQPFADGDFAVDADDESARVFGNAEPAGCPRAAVPEVSPEEIALSKALEVGYVSASFGPGQPGVGDRFGNTRPEADLIAATPVVRRLDPPLPKSDCAIVMVVQPVVTEAPVEVAGSARVAAVETRSS